MRAWAPVVGALLLLPGLPAGQATAEDTPTPAATPVPAVPASHLRLGPYAGFSLPAVEFAVPELLRFETEVEVRGKSPNEQMFAWWEHFHLESAIYGRGTNIQSPIPGSGYGYSILPVFDWLKTKQNKYKMKPEDTDAEGSPETPPPP
jgi:hypothetical protein